MLWDDLMNLEFGFDVFLLCADSWSYSLYPMFYCNEKILNPPLDLL
jgi:hypothetical protein